MEQMEHNTDGGVENGTSGPAADGDAAETAAPISSLSEEQADAQSAQKDDKPLAESLRIVESLIFASDEILTTDKLKSILPGHPDARKIRSMVESINVQLQKQRHPFEIVEIGGGYQFRTLTLYYQWVQQLFKEKTAKKLSIQSLECLAIIAYKQPITKAEIEMIRGVISDGAMKTLLEKRLITISGRSEKAGRPLLYATTKEFLTYFGLNKLTDLPRIDEFEALAKEKLGELSEAELTNLETEKKNVRNEEQVNAAETTDAGKDLPVQNTDTPGTEA